MQLDGLSTAQNKSSAEWTHGSRAWTARSREGKALVSYDTYRNHFGTLEQIFAAAGLGLELRKRQVPIALARRLRDEGLSWRAIEKELQVPHSTIREALARPSRTVRKRKVAAATA